MRGDAMKPAKLRALLQYRLASEQLAFTMRQCPPHKFQAGWMDGEEGNAKGAIFCEMCGDIRALEPQVVGAPEVEMVAPILRAE